MGYIKEPDGVNFIVDPTPLTKNDRKLISDVIAYYKATGRKMPLKKTITDIRPKRKRVSITTD